MLTREFGNFKHVTPLMGVAVAIGVCWAALSLLMMIVAPLSVVIAFMSGPVMVVYGSMLYLSRGLNFATSIGAAVLGVFGLFHMLWMPVIVLVFMASLPAGLASMFDSYPTLVAATGIIFSIVIASITGSWKAFLVMLSGTVVATAADRFLPYVPGPDQIPGFGIAILHLSIVATLLFTTLAAIAARERSGVCKSCGYDLTGNVGGVCPECGFDALHPPLHPFDLEVTGERPRD